MPIGRLAQLIINSAWLLNARLNLGCSTIGK
jgi:hypothetical protein